MNMIDQRELVPLEGGLRKTIPAVHASRKYTRENSRRPGSCVKGPMRALRLLLLIALIPALFVSIPLYLRYHVFSGQMYPMSMSDMRLIDGKISTTWCQRQVLKSNATFNAFLVSQKPEIANQLVPVTMTRHLLLEDDMKEYWGFYLLKGSIVTVSACVRWPGASLIMIRGHKHLQECAYIGDNSSEELEELLEAYGKGLLGNNSIIEKIQSFLRESPTNNPENMKRHHSDVTFHDPAQAESQARAGGGGGAAAGKAMDARGKGREGVEQDPKELQQILELLHAQEIKVKKDKGRDKPFKKPKNIISVPELINRHRETNIDRNEEQWLSFKDLDEEKKTINAEDEDHIVQMPNRRLKDSKKYISTTEEVLKKPNTMAIIVKSEPAQLPKNTTVNDGKNETQSKSGGIEKTPNSMEVYEDVLEKLSSLGDNGKGVLERLNHRMASANSSQENSQPGSDPKLDLDEMERLADEKIEALKNILEEVIREHEHKKESRDARRSANAAARDKRDLYIKNAAADLAQELNADDAEGDVAMEEGLEPDGYADDHRILNETTPNDMSNSEFWSSFSSSEEALLECEGLILNLPLTPHTACAAGRTDKDHHKAALPNAVTYRVPANGYYFFVFNSENEVQTNFIRVRFDLQKTIYDLTTENKIMECKNSTEKCTLPLDIFSNEKVVLEVPLSENDSLWNEDFVVISECEPRTSVYLVCVIAVPLLIIIFGFQ